MQTLKRMLPLQLLAVVFSFSSACLKMASNAWSAQGLFAPKTILWMAAAVFLLGIYAFFWQRVLEGCQLSVAYLNKSTTILWSLLWAVLFFEEQITGFNLLGIGCVFLGVVLVSAHE